MSAKSKALIWAAIIMAAAIIANGQGLSDSASFTITMGLTGAAIASITTGRRGRECC